MILVSGGTGFIGQVVVRQLKMAQQSVRLLLRPSSRSPKLPTGIAVEAAISSLQDERSLRAALKGVDTVIHLAGAERWSSRADLSGVDVAGTQVLSHCAAEAGVQKFIFLSHLGADQASAFAVLRAKGLAEIAIQRSGVPAVILRSAVVFGPGDQFTTSLARLLKVSPGIFFSPGKGESILQPIWVEDLGACILGLLDDETRSGKTIQVGGGEYFTFKQIVDELCRVLQIKRKLVELPPAYLRGLALWMENSFPNFPVSIYWLDYLSADRSCPIDSLTRQFGILPARFGQQLDYLVDEIKKPVLNRKTA